MVSVAPSTEPALDAAKAFLAKYDAFLATAIPTPGSAATALNDGCYLQDGRSKAYSVADFDADPLAVASRQAGVGTVRSNVKVLAERTSANADGTSRREIDIKYDIAYKDGSKFESPVDTTLDETMPIRLTPKDTIGGSFTRRQTLPVVAAPSFWALTG